MASLFFFVVRDQSWPRTVTVFVTWLLLYAALLHRPGDEEQVRGIRTVFRSGLNRAVHRLKLVCSNATNSDSEDDR